ncbi:MAG: WD40 repeat domain-containing protein, partial [Gemmataceae bacterium]
RWFVTVGPDHTLRLHEALTGRVRLSFPGHTNTLYSIEIAPDSRWIFSASADAPIYQWDVRGEVLPAGPPLTAERLQHYWANLKERDAAAALYAIRQFARHPAESLPFLKEQLRPVPKVNTNLLRGLFMDLQADDYGTRATAQRSLRGQGEEAIGMMKEELRTTTNTETREALSEILQKLLQEPTGEQLRPLRALEALEWMNTPEALALVRLLATGEPDAQITRDAKAIARRLTPGPPR